MIMDKFKLHELCHKRDVPWDDHGESCARNIECHALNADSHGIYWNLVYIQSNLYINATEWNLKMCLL